jgi:predicted  nucleic acid-binding Zn-ribbon protein
MAKVKALRARDDLEKQLELSKMQNSEANQNEQEQVKQLADQVRQTMEEKEKLQEEFDGCKSQLSTLQSNLEKSNEEVSLRVKQLEKLKVDLEATKADLAAQKTKSDEDIIAVKARLADAITSNIDLKEKVKEHFLLAYLNSDPYALILTFHILSISFILFFFSPSFIFTFPL